MKNAAALRKKMPDRKSASIEINVQETYYRELNQELRKLVADGARNIKLRNVFGQRYIATDLPGDDVKIEIHGTPGNDLGAFMNGPSITVFGNAQDGLGNTMNEGRIVVHGHAGDTLGMAMRGGEIYIRDNVGYRCGIHMKEYQAKKPTIVIGGTSQDFFCEYMAGGNVILLGLTLKPGEHHHSNFLGTGMHGGAIYIRGTVQPHQLGKELGERPITDEDRVLLETHVNRFTEFFGGDPKKILRGPFTKYVPVSLRPYGKLYAY